MFIVFEYIYCKVPVDAVLIFINSTRKKYIQTAIDRDKEVIHDWQVFLNN